ncbi:MAG: hypothetical protein ACR2L1_01570 [Pyrinomonadaceae bacterium]
MPIDEDEVYIGTKTLLQNQGWLILAGQPPSGSDHIPVIEIKDYFMTEKGSRKSYKPDLVAYKENKTLLVECKPEHSDEDAIKLTKILTNPLRVQTLFDELYQRNIFNRYKIILDRNSFAENLCGALAHSGTVIPQTNLFIIYILNMYGEGEIIYPVA